MCQVLFHLVYRYVLYKCVRCFVIQCIGMFCINVKCLITQCTGMFCINVKCYVIQCTGMFCISVSSVMSFSVQVCSV